MIASWVVSGIVEQVRVSVLCAVVPRDQFIRFRRRALRHELADSVQSTVQRQIRELLNDDPLKWS